MNFKIVCKGKDLKKEITTEWIITESIQRTKSLLGNAPSELFYIV